jgi:hypothetical protein
MSFEVMWEDTDPCRCGRGTIISRFEMDDWNRTRRTSETFCPSCVQQDNLRLQAQHQAEKRREKYVQEARALAEKRYLQQWLHRFANCSAKAAWLQYTGGSGYPCLGTFYKHVKDFGGIIPYMGWCFGNSFESALTQMGVCDQEIATLLLASKAQGEDITLAEVC